MEISKSWNQDDGIRKPGNHKTVLILRHCSGQRLHPSAAYIRRLFEKTNPICSGLNGRKVFIERYL